MISSRLAKRFASALVPREGTRLEREGVDVSDPRQVVRACINGSVERCRNGASQPIWAVRDVEEIGRRYGAFYVVGLTDGPVYLTLSWDFLSFLGVSRQEALKSHDPALARLGRGLGAEAEEAARLLAGVEGL